MILIKNINLDDKIKDILISGNKISRIADNIEHEHNFKIIDGTDKAIIPGLVNGHTHTGMTLFRGYGDDHDLQTWLTKYVWPAEKELTDEDIYWGVQLACLEMIKSGTTCFNDMYWKMKTSAEAVEKMGLRAYLCEPIIDANNNNDLNLIKKSVEESLSIKSRFSDRINVTVAPHAVYTVSTNTFKWLRDFAKANDLIIHTHLSETPHEVSECLRIHGMTPFKYLNSLKVLSPKLISAHSLWLTDEDIRIIADNDVKVVHNPNSNLKLGSGYRFRYEDLSNNGVVVGIGTDGCASSNNLDMLEAMKMASFLQKGWRNDPTAMTATETLNCGTENGGKLFGIKTGKIEEGYLADLVIIDLMTPSFTPNYNFKSNLIYAAHGNYVDTVICDGKILMEDKTVPNEKEILRNASRVAAKLLKK